LPPFEGSPIHLEFRPGLTAHRGKLLSGDANRGRPLYAASFLRERRIVLEENLASETGDLRLILAHELYHFAWWRLGNNRRAEYDSLLRTELTASAAGELGESSSVAKQEHVSRGFALGGNFWKHYVCESFCDTGAWLFSGVDEHRCFRLAAKWRIRRASWFRSLPRLKV
jgi:hypothetical protein